jgi:hypothetical protein
VEGRASATPLNVAVEVRASAEARNAGANGGEG